MRTRLLFPPTADPAHPPLGIAALSGYLAANGEEVSLLDLNIRAWNELLSAEYLRQCAETLRRRISAFNRRRKLMPSDCRAYSAITENLLSEEWLIERIDDARARLREPSSYTNRDAYAQVSSIIRRSLQFISAAHHPAVWSPCGFSTGGRRFRP